MKIQKNFKILNPRKFKTAKTFKLNFKKNKIQNQINYQNPKTTQKILQPRKIKILQNLQKIKKNKRNKN